MKKLLAIAMVGGLALLLGVLVRFWQPSDEQTGLLPDFILPDLNGRKHAISEWSGKPLIINFWSTWCPSCLKEIPNLVALQAQYANSLQIIGIAVDDKAAVNQYIASNPINYPILLVGDQLGMELAYQLGDQIGAIPYTLVVDHQGNIKHRHPGELTKEQLIALIEEVSMSMSSYGLGAP